MINKAAKKYCLLEECLALSIKEHKGQYDLATEPYIMHPLRVMQSLLPDLDAAIVGILHDAEDWKHFPKKMKLLKKILPDHLYKALKLLAYDANTGKVPYLIHLKKILKNKLACKVKLADLNDNLDKRRVIFIKHVVEREGKNFSKWYREHKQARKILKRKLKN